MKDTGEIIYDCIQCGKPVQDYEPKMCCSGRDCGCLGQPTEPAICSQECWDKFEVRNDPYPNSEFWKELDHIPRKGEMACIYCGSNENIQEIDREPFRNIYMQPYVFITYKHDCRKFRRAGIRGWRQSFPTSKINWLGFIGYPLFQLKLLYWKLNGTTR